MAALQTIAFLAHLKYVVGVPGPHLVICPLSVLSSWMTELKRFCPSLRAIKLHSSDPDERKRLMGAVTSQTGDLDVVVTTYEMAKSPNVHSQLAARSWWRYLIIDEGHVIKNDGSQISQAVRRFHFTHALLLTGTPLQNNLHELWALLNFLYPDVFRDSSSFDSAFALGSSRGTQVDTEQLAAASKLLRPFMLRRTKDEVEKGMPPKLETTISCPLSEMQLFWYKRLLLRESSLLKELEQAHAGEASAGGTDWKRLSSLLMQLRKCCNHPFLFPGVEPLGGESYAEQLISGSGKFALLDRLLAKLFAQGHRVVLFSQFTSTLDLLEELLTYREYKYCRLDGSTNRVQRTVDINAFNMLGSSRFVFLMSTRAGGLGINCQTADTCILFDSDWNPQVRRMCTYMDISMHMGGRHVHHLRLRLEPAGLAHACAHGHLHARAHMHKAGASSFRPRLDPWTPGPLGTPTGPLDPWVPDWTPGYPTGPLGTPTGPLGTPTGPLDPDWTPTGPRLDPWAPQNDVQAMARSHRIGQQKQVKVFRLVTRNTYESALLDCANR